MEKTASSLAQCLSKVKCKLIFLLLGTLFSIFYVDAQAQNKRVTGKVSNSYGAGMPHVNVTVKGSAKGTTTDSSGNYAIDVSSNDRVLIFSRVGFAAQEEKLDERRVISVTLVEKFDDLEEVVVIGYGTTVKKKDLTGAVASANLNNVTTFPNVSIAQALQGSVPGLNVGAVTEAGQNPVLSIRAQNTLSGKSADNAPLIVVDGIIYRGSLVDINPGDIASLDVLKDASSAAIYGSEASNGVILITTKAGKTSEKPVVEYSGSYSVQTPSNELKPMRSAEYEKFYPDIFWAEGGRLAPDYLEVNPNYTWQSNLKTNEIIKGYEAGLDNAWWDLFTRNGSVNTHNLSIRGKSKSVGYFVSGGLTDQKGYLKNDNYKRYNLRVNLDFKLTQWLDIGTQSFVSISDYSGVTAGVNTPFYFQPWTPIYDSLGEYMPLPDGITLNPYLSIQQKDADIRKTFVSNLYANVKLPVKGLSYRLNYSNNFRTLNTSKFNPYDNNFTGQATKEYGQARDYTVDNILTYKRTFNADHSLNVTMLYGVERRAVDTFSAEANRMEIDFLGYDRLQAGEPTQNVIKSNKEVETSLYSMARLLYDYKNKYYITGTIRRDGFSGFGEKNKIGLFPTVAISWDVTKEAFLQNSSWLNFLKLRASYGKTGRRGVGRYDTKAKVNILPSYVFGDGGNSYQGQGITSLSNNELGWESTTGFNSGLDFAIIHSRLRGSVDFYKNRTNNILATIRIPNITGFSNINTNIAEVSNQGLDLSLTGLIIDNKNFQWNATLNYSRYRNKIESILGADNDGDGKEDDIASDGLFIGQPQSLIYGYEIIGMWQLADTANGMLPAGFFPGTYKLNDLNKDGAISSLTDRKILGYADPAYRFSIANNMSYKNFSLYVFINSIQGGKKYYYGNDSPHANGSWTKRDRLSSGNVPSGAWDYWMPENPNAKYRRLDFASQYGGDRYTQRSFIRLQDVSVSYRFSNALTNTLHVSNVRAFISAKNLVTLTQWNGVDPETGAGLDKSPTAAGFIPGAPVLKSFTIGFNVEF